MKHYKEHVNTKETSQQEAIFGREDEMTTNYAGGVVFKLDDWKLLDRFLILGSDKPTYYASAKKLTIENASNIVKLIKQDGKKVVDRLVEVSTSGIAPNNDNALFVLAMVVGLGEIENRRYAIKKLHKVARIGTHLFHFIDYVTGFRGWGNILKKGVSNWYSEKDINKLALQVIKYQSRDGWSHRDLLRLSHAKTDDKVRNKIYAWITHGVGNERHVKDEEVVQTFPYTIEDIKEIALIYAFELAKKAKSEDEIVELIEKYNLPREAIPTEFIGKKVYGALLPNMPMTALIRNLGNLSKTGVLDVGNFDEINLVVDKLTNEENLRKARIHPIQLLIALKTYSAGHGTRGNNTWNVVPQIVDALNTAFYKSFIFIEPSKKKILIALDVSGSMTWENIAGIEGLTPRVASAAMAMVTMRCEKNWAIVGFSGKGGINTLNLSSTMRLDDVERVVTNLPFGSTDCSLPAIWAMENKKDFDAIIIYTDSETWAGKIQPIQAMKNYRKQVGHDVKLIVVGMTATEFSIADPEDASMLDCVGFDSGAPSIIADFIADKL